MKTLKVHKPLSIKTQSNPKLLRTESLKLTIFCAASGIVLTQHVAVTCVSTPKNEKCSNYSLHHLTNPPESEILQQGPVPQARTLRYDFFSLKNLVIYSRSETDTSKFLNLCKAAIEYLHFKNRDILKQQIIFWLNSSSQICLVINFFRNNLENQRKTETAPISISFGAKNSSLTPEFIYIYMYIYGKYLSVSILEKKRNTNFSPYQRFQITTSSIFKLCISLSTSGCKITVEKIFNKFTTNTQLVTGTVPRITFSSL